MKKYDPLKEPSSEEWLSLNEQERINLAVDYHRRAQVRLPNVKVHAIVHVIVENQIALGDEIPAGATVQRLMSEGLDRHDAIHAVGSVLMKNLYELLKHRETAPNDRQISERIAIRSERWRSAAPARLFCDGVQSVNADYVLGLNVRIAPPAMQLSRHYSVMRLGPLTEVGIRM